MPEKVHYWSSPVLIKFRFHSRLHGCSSNSLIAIELFLVSQVKQYLSTGLCVTWKNMCFRNCSKYTEWFSPNFAQVLRGLIRSLTCMFWCQKVPVCTCFKRKIFSPWDTVLCVLHYLSSQLTSICRVPGLYCLPYQLPSYLFSLYLHSARRVLQAWREMQVIATVDKNQQ